MWYRRLDDLRVDGGTFIDHPGALGAPRVQLRLPLLGVDRLADLVIVRCTRGLLSKDTFAIILKMIVKIQLIDGECQTLSSTLELLTNLPPPVNNTIYWGPVYIEDFELVGLCKENENRIVHVNVGGVIFTARECVLRTTKYLIQQ